MKRWEGRVALVTGASGGIGAAICEELVKKGMTVLGVGSHRLHEHDVDNLAARLNAEDLGYTGRFFAYRCDLSNADEIGAMYGRIRDEQRKIQLCINNAVIMKNSSLVDGQTSDWQDMLKVNVLGLCINTREAVTLMLELIGKEEIDEGQVIQMGGILGHKIPSLAGKPKDTPNIDLHFYAGTKFMVRGLTEGLRKELKNRKIRVSTISPGAVQTKLLEKATSEKEAAAYYGAYRCLQPKDVADAVKYILSTPTYQNVHDIIMEPVDFEV